MTQTLYEERDRATIRAERNNTTLQEQCPTYFNEDVWRSFCSHWRNRSFKEKSAINAKNRSNLQVVHTTGAKPFYKYKQDLDQKYSESPTVVQYWDETHKSKNTEEFASERARLIGNQMREILATKEASGEASHDWKTGISALVEAQGQIKKNRVLGLPRVPANAVIQALQDRSQPTSSRSGAGSSRSGPGIPDERFDFP
ncbi:putative transposase, Ptta/En/Spm, plant [Helianthus anomalus]